MSTRSSGRKARSDSAEEAVRVAQAAGQEIVPPSNVPLESGDLPFFASVIAEFARSEWSAHQLELAAMLARTMADLEREQRAMRTEESVMLSQKGHYYANPRKQLIQMHAASILSFRRSLSLHARARAGEARDLGKRREREREQEAGSLARNDLIARPN